MKPTIILPPDAMARFHRDLKRLVELSSREASVALNSRAYMIAKGALENTKVASRQEIESLGMRTIEGASTFHVSKKTGRLREKRKFDFRRSEAVKNYIAALIHHRGGAGASAYLRAKWPTSGTRKNRKTGKLSNVNYAANAETGAAQGGLERAARRWIGKKLRSMGFLKSTWIPILRKLDRYAEQKGKVEKPTQAKPNDVRSYANPATSTKLEVTFGNIVGADKYGNEFKEKPRNLLLIALRRSWGREMHKMAAHLEKKLREAAIKAGATVR